MEFDSPFRVHRDGSISTGIGVYAPEVLDETIEDSGWEFVSGFSGQDRYSGPIMHDSEYLGGYMAEHVLENPGVYVLVAAYWSPEEGEDESAIEGWCLLRQTEDEA